MPKKMKMQMRARGGLARGGVPASGVGSTVGQWVEDWLVGWLGLANGGEVKDMVADLTDSEQNKLLKEAKKDLIKAVKMGDVDLPADAPVAASGVGSTVGQWVEDWLVGWLGLARGGTAMARGGMAMKRGGHSVFH
jgi:hypothetical protein